MGLTALIVDDSKVSQVLLTKYLKEYGVEQFLYAKNGNEAKSLAEKANFILTDLVMEHLDGIEFTRWVRSHKFISNIPVFLITSSFDDEDNMKIIENGIDVVLAKPVEKKILFSILDKYLSKKGKYTNLSYLDPFIDSTKNIFQNFFKVSLESTPSKYCIDEPVLFDITSIISFSGSGQGSLLLSQSKISAIKFVTALLPINSKITDDILYDGVGEISNMIAGNAKQGLKKMDISIELSIPNIIQGNHYKISRPGSPQSIYTKLECEMGSFILDLGLVKSGSSNSAFGKFN